MKRDLDLVRMILLEAEEADGRLDLSRFVDASHSLDLLGFHVAMMADAGLVDADVGHAMGGRCSSVTVNRLTWAGEDYLDAIRSDTVWQRVKAAMRDTVGDTALSVVKEAGLALSLSLIKAKLGV